MLDAVGYDPLRAQEVEEGLTQEWWIRYKAARHAQAEAEEASKADHD